MRLCPIAECVGEVLGKSIYHANGKLLLGAGFRINDSIISKLKARGVSHVYIMEEGTEEVVPIYPVGATIKVVNIVDPQTWSAIWVSLPKSTRRTSTSRSLSSPRTNSSRKSSR